MKRNGCKSKELKDSEDYYRIEYKSKLSKKWHWHKATGRNILEAKADFEEAIDVSYVEEITEPVKI